MMFKLTNAYSLCITISFELNDVSIYTINEKEVKDVEIIMLLLAAYYPNIITISIFYDGLLENSSPMIFAEAFLLEKNTDQLRF